MCGIAGILASRFAPDELRSRVEAMQSRLRHRGPDGEGIFMHAEVGTALVHSRLAILDLSDAGLQPMSSPDGRYTIVFNGEIYNYRELRAELESRGHRFRSQTDTEVVLAGYREWGDRCVERFNGMWAFALWDGERRRLFCSRDRFGVKPFYYRYRDGRFVFASELKAFRADPEVRLTPNPRAVRDYVEQGYLDHTDETFFRGIVRLPPAHSLVLDQHGLRLRRYWSLEPRDPKRGFKPRRRPARVKDDVGVFPGALGQQELHAKRRGN